jgi:hypothetical protein
MEHDKVIRYLVERIVVPDKARSHSVRFEVPPIVFGLLIIILTVLLGFSVKALSTCMTNESKLNKIIDMLVIKYPDMRFEVDTLRMHQDIASAPVLYLARVLTFLFGRVSTSFIMVVDKALKLVFSCILVSAIAYLFLKQTESSAIGKEDTQTTGDSMGELLRFIETIGTGQSETRDHDDDNPSPKYSIRLKK